MKWIFQLTAVIVLFNACSDSRKPSGNHIL